jgi:hypothetical protein
MHAAILTTKTSLDRFIALSIKEEKEAEATTKMRATNSWRHKFFSAGSRNPACPRSARPIEKTRVNTNGAAHESTSWYGMPTPE